MSSSTPPPDDPRARLLVAFAAGQEVFREGRPGAEMFIIEDGEVEISRLHGAAEKRLSTLGPGDFFGEMALLEDRPRSATARARTACKLLPIDASTFDQLLRDNSEIAIRMMRSLSGRLRRYEDEEARAAVLAQAVIGGSRADLPKLQPIEPAPAPPPPAAAVAATSGHLVHAASGRSFPVPAGRDLAVGRFDPVTEMSPDVDLTELDVQRSTSRRHARLAARDGRFFVREEIGTANGTYVGAERLTTGVEHELRDGDAVRFGRVDLVFRVGHEG
jgi:CRP-like cAMP-binding protein